MGRIHTSDGKPAESVSVILKGTTKGAVADRNGQYEIKNISPGNYIVSTSFTGLETKETSIAVNAGSIVIVDFVLIETDRQLQEVIISANRIKTNSEYVAKMPLKNLENPQVYNVVSADLIRQQGITSYDDALKNVPGIFRLWESTGRADDGGSYFSLRGFESQLTMLNGLPGLTNGNLDPANLERIEVIKGPSGTLFGSPVISYGGLVNNVTKKPYEGIGGEIGYTAGSFGLNRVTADVNVPLNKDNTLLARINTAYHSENSFQDYGFRKSFFVAPTISYKASEKLSFLLVTEFMQEEKTNPLMIFLGRSQPLQFKNLDDLNYDRKLSLTSNELSVKSPRYNIQAQMTYKLSDKWTSQTVLSNGQTNSNGYYTYLYDNEDGHRDFGLWATKTNGTTYTTDIQQNFTGDFNIGSFRNRVLVGLDYFNRKVSNSGTGYARIHNVNLQGEINYRDPDNPGEDIPTTYLTKASVDARLASAKGYPWSPTDEAYSTYISDVFNFLPQLSAMASLRVDHFKTSDYGQTTLSPKLGIMYQPVKDQVSVFVNYMDGFRNIAPGVVVDDAGTPTGVTRNFRPEHATQFEAGIKTNLVKNRLTATVSYYDITVEDIVMTDPSNIFNSIQGGKAGSKGFEADIQTSPFEGLNLLIGYSYNDSKVLKGDVGQKNSWFEQGKRPLYAGPVHLGNAWATYKIPTGKLNGFGIGFGGNYVGENLTLNLSETGNFIIPAYTVLNGSLFYNASKFRIGFNLNNITNKGYAGGWSTVNPQKTRNFVLSLTYKF